MGRSCVRQMVNIPTKLHGFSVSGHGRSLRAGNSYCSGVCCAYTQKQVILSKDHHADLDATIFHNDIRAFGKDFERFYQRAENLPDVRFIRSYVSIGREIPETKNVTIRYSTFDEGVKEEEFDMVVLSVGLAPPKDALDLAQKFGIELNPHQFCLNKTTNPIETSRPGIFVSGAFQGPIDIPESVVTASGADALCSQFLAYRRGDLAKDRVYPPERDVSGEEPKVGVFVCHCGANIGRVVDVPDVVEYAKTLPGVVHAQESLFACSTDNAQQISIPFVKRALTGWWSLPVPPEPMSRCFAIPVVKAESINTFTRWPTSVSIAPGCIPKRVKKHPESQRNCPDVGGAIDAARAIGRIRFAGEQKLLGGWRRCSRNDQFIKFGEPGIPGLPVEKASELGGMARNLYYTLEGMDVQGHVKDLIRQVYRILPFMSPTMQKFWM